MALVGWNSVNNASVVMSPTLLQPGQLSKMKAPATWSALETTLISAVGLAEFRITHGLAPRSTAGTSRPVPRLESINFSLAVRRPCSPLPTSKLTILRCHDPSHRYCRCQWQDQLLGKGEYPVLPPLSPLTVSSPELSPSQTQQVPMSLTSPS